MGGEWGFEGTFNVSPETLAASARLITAAISQVDILGNVKVMDDFNKIFAAPAWLKGKATSTKSMYHPYYDLSTWKNLSDFAANIPNFAAQAYTQLAEIGAGITANAALWPGYGRILQMEAGILTALNGWDAKFDAATSVRDKYAVSIPANRYWNKFFERGRPEVKDWFLMYKKGLAALSDVKDSLMEDKGLSDAMADKYIQHLDYDPSFGELLRLTDFVDLPTSWVSKKLDAMGLNTEDKALFTKAIERRQLKDEIARAWGGILSAYTWGLFSETELSALFTTWGLSTVESNLRLTTAELERDKNETRLKRDAYIYQFRKGAITNTQLFTNLTALGIVSTTANALVMMESARAGVEWIEP